MPVNRDLKASMEGDNDSSRQLVPNPNSSRKETVVKGIVCQKVLGSRDLASGVDKQGA